jgi:alkylated DNA repair dioxygenase AlkB
MNAAIPMNQCALFGRGEQTLLNDSTGIVTYLPEFIIPDRAQAWFEALGTQIAWKSGRRMMYNREVDIPRLTAHFRVVEAPLPPTLSDALELVRTHVKSPFDSVGLNLYRDQHDSVAPHNDRTEDLVKGEPIALLSLGASRTMVIRQKKPPSRQLRIELEAGSLLIMSWETQVYYDHGIPKQRGKVGPRISVAFRVRPQLEAR